MPSLYARNQTFAVCEQALSTRKTHEIMKPKEEESTLDVYVFFHSVNSFPNKSEL